MLDLLDILDEINQFFAELRPYSGYFLMLYGLVECYLGSRIFRYFMAFTGYLMVLIIGRWFPVEWIEMALVRYVVISFLGIGFGTLFFYNRFLRIFVKGIVVFFVLGFSFMHLFDVASNNLVLVGVGFLGGFIFLVADRGTRIVGLSLLGGLLFIYGCMLAWGWGVFQEMSFVLSVVDLDFRLIGILLLWAILFATGVVFQTKLTS